MQILSIGNFGHSWDGSICDEEHIAVALEQLDHSVIRCQRETAEEKEVPAVDFVLIAQWDGYAPHFLNRFHAAGIPVVYWAFDYQDQEQEWHQELIDQADLYLSKRIADSVFSNWHWLSQDFFPDLLRPADDVEKDIDVLFTGTYLPWAKERNETLKAIDDFCTLQIRSINPEGWIEAGFRNVAGPVIDEELPDIIARAKVNIAIDHTYEAGYWSDRTAQIMACGGFVMMRYVPLAETRFEYVPFFKNTAGALGLIDEMLRDDTQRDRIAFFGTLYARKHLSAQIRVMDLLYIVENCL